MFSNLTHRSGVRVVERVVEISESGRAAKNDPALFVLAMAAGLPFGGTDVALPMIYARKRGLEIDAFVVYTDSETWAGAIHPVQALQAYRRQTGIPARLVVVGMVSNGFSVADPDDAGMLDVVGFDTAAPALITDFIRNDNFST